MVRLEQRNDSFFAMNIFFDGPFETGSEREKNPELVPVPDNSYMGKVLVFYHFTNKTFFSRADLPPRFGQV